MYRRILHTGFLKTPLGVVVFPTIGDRALLLLLPLLLPFCDSSCRPNSPHPSSHAGRRGTACAHTCVSPRGRLLRTITTYASLVSAPVCVAAHRIAAPIFTPSFSWGHRPPPCLRPGSSYPHLNLSLSLCHGPDDSRRRNGAMMTLCAPPPSLTLEPPVPHSSPVSANAAALAPLSTPQSRSPAVPQPKHFVLSFAPTRSNTANSFTLGPALCTVPRRDLHSRAPVASGKASTASIPQQSICRAQIWVPQHGARIHPRQRSPPR